MNLNEQTLEILLTKTQAYADFQAYLAYYGVDPNEELTMIEKFISLYLEKEGNQSEEYQNGDIYLQGKYVADFIGRFAQYIEKDWFNFGYPRIIDEVGQNVQATKEEVRNIADIVAYASNLGFNLANIGFPRPRPNQP